MKAISSSAISVVTPVAASVRTTLTRWPAASPARRPASRKTSSAEHLTDPDRLRLLGLGRYRRGRRMQERLVPASPPPAERRRCRDIESPDAVSLRDRSDLAIDPAGRRVLAHQNDLELADDLTAALHDETIADRHRLRRDQRDVDRAAQHALHDHRLVARVLLRRRPAERRRGGARRAMPRAGRDRSHQVAAGDRADMCSMRHETRWSSSMRDLELGQRTPSRSTTRRVPTARRSRARNVDVDPSGDDARHRHRPESRPALGRSGDRAAPGRREAREQDRHQGRESSRASCRARRGGRIRQWISPSSCSVCSLVVHAAQ